MSKFGYLADGAIGTKFVATLPTNPAYRVIPANDLNPTIASLDVTTGPVGGGTTVVITGTNLSSAYLVTFGGLPVSLAGSDATITPTSITCITPAYVGPGAVDVRVVTPQGVAVAAGAFTYASGIGPLAGLSDETGDHLLTETGDYLNWE